MAHENSEKIKDIIVQLAVTDKLPMDLNELDASIFDELFPVVDLLTNERREDMLCGALEGGSNYWYYLPDTSMCDKHEAKETKSREPLVSLMMRAVIAGESVPVHDLESITNDVEGDSGDLLGYFDMTSIRKGEELMREKAPTHWANLVGENDDAETADVWFQYCVLGDIVYG